ncbi:class 1 fructose-bisphosphatase [candidate division KSB1 bacterium]
MVDNIITIDRHIFEKQRRFPFATGEFSLLISDIAFASKIISSEVNKAGLIEILGFTGNENVYGEKVKKLDEYANDTFVRVLEAKGHLCAMSSEEMENVITIPEQYPTGKYVINFDPLDGSSNIDANVSIGSIFSIFRRVSVGRDGNDKDCIQKGSAQIAAGYIIYGSSTMFVYSTGDGVHGFTLDPSIGEFFLSHEDIRIPDKGYIYSVNEGNYIYWDDNIKKYIDYLKDENEKEGRPYKSRYIGSLVADFHRNLLYGGVFLYPGDKKVPKGKLRLLYEANPMAFIAESAGGAASDGKTRILDIAPEKLTQRTPLIIGSKKDVEMAEKFIAGKIK